MKDNTNSSKVKNWNILNYKYVLLNIIYSDLDTEKYKSKTKKSIFNSLKTTKDMENYFNNWISFWYTYFDKNKTFLLDIIITPEEYYISFPTEFSDL